MSINDLPVLSALRTKMQCHQEGHGGLPETVCTSHIAPAGAGQNFQQDRGKGGFQTRPAGNAVNLEDQMLKVSANQMDYAAATSLYSKSLHLLKTAIGKG